MGHDHVLYPAFLVGLLLILVFSLTLGWFPAGGWPGDVAGELRLPHTSGHRFVDHDVDSRHPDGPSGRDRHAGTAVHGGGLHPRAAASVLNVKHILPNSLLPVLTLIGISFGTLLTGAIIVESVFGIPGLGSEMSQAVSRRDYPVIQGIALISAIVVVVSGYLVEIAYTFVDPRARTL